MGNNFIVASFVPALGFIVSNVLIFLPIMPPSIRDYIKEIGNNFLQVTIVVLLFTILLGFTLFTLSTYIYKVFEGYTFIFSSTTIFGKAGLKRQRRRVKLVEIKKRKIERAIQSLESRSYSLLEKSEDERTISDLRRLARYQETIEKLESQRYAIIANYNANFPRPELILPTRFGNILRAAETYPGERYGIDAVELWPRLAHSIPPEGMTLIDQANNECLFLLNSSLLASFLSILSLLAAVYQYLLSTITTKHELLLDYFNLFYQNQLNEYQQVSGLFVLVYVLISIIIIFIAWFFYEASLLNVGQFGLMIKSSYDIYRFNLIEDLHFSLPPNLGKEIELWQKIGTFFATGFEIDYDIDFRYSHKKNKL